MKEIIEEPIYQYTCDRCGKEWDQRTKNVYEEDGLKIKERILIDPKNCTLCKSILWNGPVETD